MNVMTGEEKALRSGLLAFVTEARQIADYVDPIVSKYETRSGEFLAGVCGAVVATVATYLLQLKYSFNVGFLTIPTLAASMFLFGAAFAMLVFRGPGRWKAENRKAKVKTFVDQMSLDLAAMRAEIDTLKAAQAPAHVMAHAWADYESALHHCAVARISAVNSTAQTLFLKDSKR